MSTIQYKLCLYVRYQALDPTDLNAGQTKKQQITDAHDPTYFLHGFVPPQTNLRQHDAKTNSNTTPESHWVPFPKPGSHPGVSLGSTRETQRPH